jgi:hypothetical protein
MTVSRLPMQLAMLAFCMTLTALTAMPTQAHHTTANVDMKRTIELKGTIRKFQWTNPHCWFWITVTDKDGQNEEWGVETAAPGMLRDAGFEWNSVKAGDKVALRAYPRVGEVRLGQFIDLTFEDGRKFSPPWRAGAVNTLKSYGVAKP